ncbi:sensor domain-containing protein [Motiliproteus coralliicola]|uniref:sensor domain-containing protein n=1 Tax=Motiliproteus coralliicola TaxID=2283196 RepID=UPI00140203A1|nr:sensor domain-containing diguanylate cyclase [Motiliproteus coralliicola]
MNAEQLDERLSNRYRVLFTDSKVPMLLIDPSTGSIIDANDCACRYYGYDHRQLTALKISQINQYTAEEVDLEMRRAMAEKRNHFFFVHQLSDGSLRHVEVHSGKVEIDNRDYLFSIIHDITDRHTAEQQLKSLNQDFITLLENTSDFVFYKDKDRRFRFCSQRLAKLTGHNNWKEIIGKTERDIFPEELATNYLSEEPELFKKAEPILDRIEPFLNEKGEKGWVSTSKWPVLNSQGGIDGIFGISRDVTAKQNSEEQLRIAASVFQNVSEGIIVTDTNGIIIETNNAFCSLSGYSREEVINTNPRFLKSGYHDDNFFAQMWHSLKTEGAWKGETWNRRKDGQLFACRTTIKAVTGPDGTVSQYIGVMTDITALLRHHEEVEQMAYYDTLTRLPNRTLLSDRLAQALANGKRNQNTIAICFLDLDNFKPVNDQYGHRAGDLLLVEVANRITECIREHDTVARLGGDEFALVLTQLQSDSDLEQIVKRILSSITQPFKLPNQQQVAVSASIGICLHPDYPQDGDLLLRYADLAMYKAKEMGRNRYYIYREGQI